MQKNKDKSNEKNERDTADFSLYDKSGRQKNFALSIIAATVGVLSIVFSALGFLGIAFAVVGIVLGAAAIALSIVAKVKLGYFNTFIIIGIFLGIFSCVLGIFFCIYITYIDEILKWIEGTRTPKKVEKV